MSVVTKLVSNPRITDRNLISLILKSPELTKAFGSKPLMDWDALEEKLLKSAEQLSKN